MPDKEMVRESARELMVQLLFVPIAVLAIAYLHGSARIVSIALIAVAAYTAVDAVRGKFGRPLNPSAITQSLASNALFVAFMASAIMIGMWLFE